MWRQWRQGRGRLGDETGHHVSLARLPRAPGQAAFPMRNIPLLLAAVLAAAAPAVSLPAADRRAVPGGEAYPLERYFGDLARREWERRAAQLARINTADEVRERAAFVRAEFLRAIGGLPAEKAPLNARVTGVLERPGYRIEKVIYESLPGCFVTANLYVPTTGAGPFPAVLGTAGHAMPEGKASPVYQSAFIGLAMRGYVVLAFDPPAQGERWELRDPATGEMKSLGHISPGLQCLLTGDTSARYFMWDGIRGLDYLLTRREVDPRKIGVAGNSGGGTQSAFLGICEPRLAAVASSCYWTDWPHQWFAGGPQDSEQILPGWIRAGLDFSDLALAFAPKPILMLTATKDSFPVEGARVAHAEARRLFGLLGAEQQMGYFEYNDGHAWSKPRREATTAWFDRWLAGRSDVVNEPAHTPEPLRTLHCTDTGHVVTALNSKTVQQLNQERAEKFHAARTLPKRSDAAQARATIARRLALAETRAAPAATGRGRADGAGFSSEAFTLVPEPGIELSVQVFTPAGSGGRRPAVIVLRDQPGAVDPAADADVAGWLKAGHGVVVAPWRGALPPAAEKRPSYYTLAYRTAMRAILLGRTITGMRVQDALAVFDFVRAQPWVAPDRISLVGRGNPGVVALYVAALEPRLARVLASGSVLSYLDLVRTPQLPEGFVDLVVPGVLQDLDLPDLAARAGRGRVVLLDPVTVDGRPAAADAAAALYGAQAKVVFGGGAVAALAAK